MNKTDTSNGVDLVVSFDTTGSMYPVLSRVRNEVVGFVKEMFGTIPNLRIGIVAHGDYCDKDNPYTIRIMDLTTDKDAICNFIRTTDRTYGGDADECYELVLNNVRTTIKWRAGSTKIMVLIGDSSPHGVNYPDNKDRIDWVEEAGILNDMGVKIFAVHALSYYRGSSRNFYNQVANITGGKYLTLDQFNEVIDLIEATCISEYSEEKLNDFVSVIRSKGRMTRTLANNINRLSSNKIDTGYSDSETVQKDGLVPVLPGRFQVMTVDENCDIRSFVESNGITFKKGRGFYELTKHETVQQYKEVIIQDRTTGEMFNGSQVRERLGLQPQIAKGGVKESLSSRDTAEFRVFVQSTSFNRKLIAGTTFLYEVDELEHVGTSIKDIDSKTVREPVKKAVEKLVKDTAKEPIKETIKDTAKEPIKEPIKETVKEPVKDSVKDKKAVTKKGSTKKKSTKKDTAPGIKLPDISKPSADKLPPIPDDSDRFIDAKPVSIDYIVDDIVKANEAIINILFAFDLSESDIRDAFKKANKKLFG